MFWKKGFLLFFWCSYLIDATKPIDMDYYLSYLRNTNCYGKHGQRHCEKQCYKVPAICHDGECYCHQSIVDAINPPNSGAAVLILARKDEVNIQGAPQNIPQSYEDGSEIMLTEEALRPALRHHIAHFCPNLDVARECIRTCMEKGKPAFCGKDHICYCGHRYSSHDSKDDQNVLDTYKEFADMYAKYFGNSGRPNDDDDNSGDDDDELLKKKTNKGQKVIKN